MQHKGTVYLIHFDKPYKHARHYIGFTTDLNSRLEQHRNGNGARLMEVIKENNIQWCITRTWENVTRHYERRLKNRKNAKYLCPICNKKGG